MATFAFLYLILVVYAIFLRLGARTNTKHDEPIGLLYKIQAWVAVGIALATATTLNILLAESILDWIIQYVPTMIIGSIVLVWPQRS